MVQTPDVREYVYLDAFVVMPDQLHGVIGLRGRHPLERAVGDEPGVDTTHRVVSTPDGRRSTLLPDSLGSILGQFKSKCTKRIRPFLPDFGWQANYYEHIIRDEDDLNRIRQYINDNPLKWDTDEDVPENLWM